MNLKIDLLTQVPPSPSCCDRISTLCSTLLLTIKSVADFVLSKLAAIVHSAPEYEDIPMNRLSQRNVIDNEKPLLQPEMRVDKTDREHYTRLGNPLDIQKRLDRELQRAQEAIKSQYANQGFAYKECENGTAKSETIGPYQVGICHFQGRRAAMEDAHLTIDFNLEIGDRIFPVQLFAVFDGHGGEEAAKFLEAQLKDELEKTLLEFNPQQLSDEGIWNALKLTFVRLDEKFQGTAGSTATVLMILDGNAWTANVGDSRTILENNETIIQLSCDAKPSDIRFGKGIANRGGQLLSWFDEPRIGGVLAVARAVGDHELGKAVSARSKITKVSLAEIEPGSHFVLACDGIWDVASTNQIGQAVYGNREKPAERLARDILGSAYSAGSRDNLSVIVVKVPKIDFK